MLNQDIANGNLMHDHEISKEKVYYKSTGTGTRYGRVVRVL